MTSLVIGSKGLFSTIAPFTLPANSEMEVIAIRSFADLTKSGVDPYERFYRINGLVDGQAGFSFAQEALLNPLIVSLKDAAGTLRYIPSTYIANIPNQNYVPYSHLVLSIALGPIADTVDLTALKTRIADITQTTVGVASTVTEHRISSSQVVSPTQHAAIEAARQGAATTANSDLVENVRLNNRISDLERQLAALKKLALDNNLLT